MVVHSASIDHIHNLRATEGNDKNAGAEKAAFVGRLGMSMWQTSKELITKIKSYSYVSPASGLVLASGGSTTLRIPL